MVSASDDTTVRVWDTGSGAAFWKATVLLSSPPRLHTQRGWRALAGEAKVDHWQGDTPWSQALNAATTLARSDPSQAWLCTVDMGQEVRLWRLGQAKALNTYRVPEVTDLVALEGACLVQTPSAAMHMGQKGPPLWLLEAGDPLALTSDGSDLIVVDGTTLRRFAKDGQPLETIAVDEGITAVHLSTAAEVPQLLIGFRDGNVSRLAWDGSGKAQQLPLEQTSASRITRLGNGPMGTLAVGYANGDVGLWNPEDGRRLVHQTLHGRVNHIVLEEQKLFAATDLGSALSWDLSAMYQSPCELLAQVWSRVPVVWLKGAPVAVAPPARHACLP